MCVAVLVLENAVLQFLRMTIKKLLPDIRISCKPYIISIY